MISLNTFIGEVQQIMESIDVSEDGEHLWTNYQYVVACALRLSQIHNEIALAEINGEADAPLKKFRTMVVDPSIERLDRIASFESRKITGRQIEANLER